MDSAGFENNKDGFDVETGSTSLVNGDKALDAEEDSAGLEKSEGVG